MFNADFYPTPPEVISTMLIGVNVQGKHFLEPSAGKGNIVDVLNDRGAESVCAFEKEKDLSTILQSKCRVLGNDFLKCSKDQVSHVDYIIMNPPFSADERHILHAWEIAPEGCTIISLCNSQTLEHAYTRLRSEFLGKVKNYGNEEKLGQCFSNSERKTNVSVSLVRLFKPVSSSSSEFEGFYMDEEESYTNENGLIKHNEVRSIVQRYVHSVKSFEKVKKEANVLEGLLAPIGLKEGFKYELSYNEAVTDTDQFRLELQKKCWKYIIDKMNIGKFVTSGVMEDINKFVEHQKKFPFTMKNIYRMVEIIIGTRGETMNRALVEAFDKITERYHENRYFLEGWKTNSHYMINQRFILPDVVEEAFGGGINVRFSKWGGQNKIDDLNKALNYLTNSESKDFRFFINDTKPDFGEKFDWSFFECRAYKKGTVHFKFKDPKVWELFNRKVAEIKGYPLPEKL